MRWDAGRHQSSFAFVPQHGKSLIVLLGPRPGERIVDLGRGTGTRSAEFYAVGGRPGVVPPAARTT